MNYASAGFLADLGVYGWEEHEVPLLASTFSGDPVLLLAGAGSAKTQAIESLAKLVLGPEEYLKLFQAYNVPSIVFEDFLGFPNPSSFANEDDIISYKKTPMSVWSKRVILLDEINRAKADIQGKYFQIILSRKVMGETTDVQLVYAAMNPLGYSGTNALDKALADRFALMLKVPEFHELSKEHQILAGMGEGSSAYLPLAEMNPELRRRFLNNKSHSEQSEARAIERYKQLKLELVGKDGQHGLMQEIWERYNEPVADYLAQIVNLMKNKIPETDSSRNERLELLTSGRRVSMIRRNILFRMGVHAIITGSDIPQGDELSHLVKDTYYKSLTTSATGVEFEGTLYEPSHRTAVTVLTSVGSLWDYRIETERDPVKKLGMVFAYRNSDGDYVSRVIDELMQVPEEEEDQPKIEDYPVKENGFDKEGLLGKYVVPTLLTLYSAPLIDLKKKINNGVRSNIATKTSKLIDYISLRMDELEGFYFAMDELDPAYEKVMALFEEKIASTGDDFYRVSRWMMGCIARSLRKIDTNPKFWAAQLEEMAHEILNVHESIKRYLFPVYRSMFFDSKLPTGMTLEEHKEEMRILSRRFRGLPDYDIEEEKSREEKLAEALATIAALNPDLAIAMKRTAKVTSVEEDIIDVGALQDAEPDFGNEDEEMTAISETPLAYAEVDEDDDTGEPVVLHTTLAESEMEEPAPLEIMDSGLPEAQKMEESSLTEESWIQDTPADSAEYLPVAQEEGPAETKEPDISGDVLDILFGAD